MTYPILRGARLVLGAERAAEAPEAIYTAECLVCDATSGWVDDDHRPVAVWALEHTGQRGLTHCQFLVTTQKHWRVDPLREPHDVAVPAPLRRGAPTASPRAPLRGLRSRLARLTSATLLTLAVRSLPPSRRRASPRGVNGSEQGPK